MDRCIGSDPNQVAALARQLGVFGERGAVFALWKLLGFGQDLVERAVFTSLPATHSTHSVPSTLYELGPREAHVEQLVAWKPTVG